MSPHLEHSLQLQHVSIESRSGQHDRLVEDVHLLGVTRQDVHLVLRHTRVRGHNGKVVAGDRAR